MAAGRIDLDAEVANPRAQAGTPQISGQRAIDHRPANLDTMFPDRQRRYSGNPGGFGTGKTMTQHQIAKWSDADIIVYIGCGERGNEMTQVLEEFSQVGGPENRQPVDGPDDADRQYVSTCRWRPARLLFIQGLRWRNTTGIWDMTWRLWRRLYLQVGGALRELSGRLEEMPAEEVIPAYLASRLSAFYERAGMMQTLNGSTGSVSIIGAVSPRRETSPSQLRRIRSDLSDASGGWINLWLTQAFSGNPLAVQLQRISE